jgi:hypothetical protein
MTHRAYAASAFSPEHFGFLAVATRIFAALAEPPFAFPDPSELPGIIYEKDEHLVGRLLRCHELARAVAMLLGMDPWRVVVDGLYLGRIDHSWIQLAQQGRQRLILDTYCPCRIPPVQLVEANVLYDQGSYVGRGDRKDIRQAVVDEIVRGLSERVAVWRGEAGLVQASSA